MQPVAEDKIVMNALGGSQWSRVGESAEWKIDVRKSSAHPPIRLREQLTRLAEDARDRARKVFLHRAQSNSSTGRTEDLASVWMS